MDNSDEHSLDIDSQSQEVDEGQESSPGNAAAELEDVTEDQIYVREDIASEEEGTTPNLREQEAFMNTGQSFGDRSGHN